MEYTYHPRFDGDITAFLRSHHTDKVWLVRLENLLKSHFEDKTTILREQILARLEDYRGYELWKVYMVVGGIRKSQQPRVVFAKVSQVIIFLGYGTHTENYSTSDLKKLAKRRLDELIDSGFLNQNRNAP